VRLTSMATIVFVLYLSTEGHKWMEFNSYSSMAECTRVMNFIVSKYPQHKMEGLCLEVDRVI